MLKRVCFSRGPQCASRFFDNQITQTARGMVRLAFNLERVLKMAKQTVTRTATATVAVAGTDFTKMFADKLKNWPVKFAGPKVTNDELARAASMISRHGTGKHLALAMYLRSDGATQGEVNIITGDTQVNAYRDARDTKVAVEVPIERRNGHKTYKLALPTPKAKKAASKRKAASKPATPAKAAKPASDAPQADNKPTDNGQAQA